MTVIVLAALAITGAVSIVALRDDPVPRRATLEPVNTPGPNPFLPNLPQSDSNGLPSGFKTGGEYSANAEGVFGATSKLSQCDPQLIWEQMSMTTATREAWVTVLAGRIEKAWVSKATASPYSNAATHPRPSKITSIDSAAVEHFIGTLTPVVLRGDTLTMNHGLRGRKTVEYLSVLQTGTSVLVDGYGVPVTKCRSGNPLTVSSMVENLTFSGTRWQEFDSQKMVALREASKPLSSLVLLDLEAKKMVPRPAGSVASATPAATISPAFGFGLTSLRDGDTVGLEQRVSGTVSGIPEGQTLWMFVVPAVSPSVYHPQAVSVDPTSNTWSGISYFGTKTAGANLDYTLIVARLTSTANADTRAYLDRHQNQNDYPGMPDLPAGSEQLISILVHRD